MNKNKKTFNLDKNSPALAFISTAEEGTNEPANKGKTTKKATANSTKTEEKKTVKVLTPIDYTVRKEAKTERLNLVTTPSLKKKLKKIKEVTGQSANDFINQVLEDVLKDF